MRIVVGTYGGAMDEIPRDDFGDLKNVKWLYEMSYREMPVRKSD